MNLHAPSPRTLAPLRPLRVLFLNDTARNGGPGRCLHTILKHLDPSEIYRAVVLPRPGVMSDLLTDVSETVLFLPDFVENPIQPVRRAMERSDFDAPVPLKGLRAGINVVKAGRSLWTLARWVRSGGFDLIYCNGTSADFAGGTVAAMTGVPALFHVHYAQLAPALIPIHRRLSSSDAVRRIVCVSGAAAKLFDHCRDKVCVLNNAIDLEEFKYPTRGVLRAEIGLDAQDIVFGAHGRVLPRKGFDVMLRAGRRALDAMSEPLRARVHFVVLGDTPEDIGPDHVEECRALARSLGMESQVAFLGFRADVRPYLRDFDVELVPSVYEDPLPRAVIEAMAFGVPVIASRVGGVGEMLTEGDGGSIVPPGDEEALAQAIVRYASDAELRREQGERGRARIARKFDARDHVAAMRNEIIRAAFGPELAGARESPDACAG